MSLYGRIQYIKAKVSFYSQNAGTGLLQREKFDANTVREWMDSGNV